MHEQQRLPDQRLTSVVSAALVLPARCHSGCCCTGTIAWSRSQLPHSQQTIGVPLRLTTIENASTANDAYCSESSGDRDGNEPDSPGLLNSSSRTRLISNEMGCGIVPAIDVSCTDTRVSDVAAASSDGKLPLTPCDDSTSACNAVRFDTAIGMVPAAAVPSKLSCLPASHRARAQPHILMTHTQRAQVGNPQPSWSGVSACRPHT